MRRLVFFDRIVICNRNICSLGIFMAQYFLDVLENLSLLGPRLNSLRQLLEIPSYVIILSMSEVGLMLDG